jgi:hypothetical protein
MDASHRLDAPASAEWVEHRFSGAYSKIGKSPASAAEVKMAIPYRGVTSNSTYFVTANTFCKQNLLQSDRMAELFCELLHRHQAANKFFIHAFVVMPNHIHLLLTVPDGMTLERAM